MFNREFHVQGPRSNRRWQAFIRLAGTSALALSAQSALAAEPQKTSADADRVADIVVVAQKREENVQRVPVTITALSADMLAKAGATSALDLPRQTPGLVAAQTGGLFQPFLRGVGNPVTAVGNESSTALYVDGVYFARLPFTFFDLSDVERIEVLKGPQGTLFGRNASGGLIQIITRDPTDSWSGKVSASYGNYDMTRLDGSVGGPIAQGVRASLSAVYKRQWDGWGRNITRDADAYKGWTYALRGKIIADVDDRTEVRLTADYIKNRNDFTPNTPYPGTTVGTPTNPPSLLAPIGFYDKQGELDTTRRDQGGGAALRITHDLGFASIMSITSYRRDKGGVVDDVDRTAFPSSVADISYHTKTVTQELQLTSNKTSPFTWIAGLYYLFNDSAFDPVLQRGSAFGSNVVSLYGQQKINSYSAFAQGTYALSSSTRLTGGIRYTKDVLDARGFIDMITPTGTVAGAVTTAHTSFEKPTFKVALDHDFAPDVMGYASFSRGYKAGTFSTLPVTTTPARPEVLDAYEVGFKSDLFDRRLRFNVAAFWYEIKDPQVQIINATSTGFITQNAKKARSRGIEAEAELVVTRGLRARFSGSYLDARYIDYKGAPDFAPNPNAPFGNLPAAVIDASGHRMIQAPKFTANASLSYHFETSAGSVDLNAGYYYNDGFYWLPDNRLRQDSYDLINANVMFTTADQRYSISVWGKNLGNSKYSTAVNSSPNRSGSTSLPGEPRIYGATVSAKF